MQLCQLLQYSLTTLHPYHVPSKTTAIQVLWSVVSSMKIGVNTNDKFDIKHIITNTNEVCMPLWCLSPNPEKTTQDTVTSGTDLKRAVSITRCCCDYLWLC